MKAKAYYILFAIVMLCGICRAQESKPHVDNIHTLQVQPGGEWGEAPVIMLGGNDYVEISFDDLTHDYERYTYRITHCNANWEQSDLLVSEYMTGFNDNVLEEYSQSMNTEMEYNHYAFTIPNERTQLLVSGNYRVEIFNDDDDENPVLTACFSVIEPKVSINAAVTANTDIDTYNTHQQLEFSILHAGLTITNPTQEIKVTCLQNHRWDTVVRDLYPTYMKVNELVYNHNRKLVYNAGNEYRRFEILDRYVPTMRVDFMRYSGGYYHATLMKDEQRTKYLFDRDQNGRFYIRNGENVENETESDYYYTHFTLVSPQLPGVDVYVNGDLTNNTIDERFRMEYNPLDHQYEATILLKQGSYNYQYVTVSQSAGPDEQTLASDQTEGNYYQTENEYAIYVYYRPFGERYDRLIGFAEINAEF